MTGPSGLGPVEVALLDAVDLIGEDGAPVRCSDVLAVVERRQGIGPRYAWPVLVDAGVGWRRHLPVVELAGNCGSAMGDPAADAQYVEVSLSPIGVLALAAERGEYGPLPLDLIEGTLLAGGRVPPFDPRAVVGSLLAGTDEAGGPVLPTGGTVEGDLDGLLAGRAVRLTLGCTIRPEGGRLVITEVPLGVAGDAIMPAIAQRAQQHEPDPSGRAYHLVRRHGSPVVDVRDDSNARDGIRLVVDLDRGTDLLAARDWLRDVWPVTVQIDCRLPAPMSERMLTWDRGDGTGLRALGDLLGP